MAPCGLPRSLLHRLLRLFHYLSINTAAIFLDELRERSLSAIRLVYLGVIDGRHQYASNLQRCVALELVQHRSVLGGLRETVALGEHLDESIQKLSAPLGILAD